MSFEHCHFCKPPARHPGCHSHCEYYKADHEKREAERAAEQKEARGLSEHYGARSFKTRRMKDDRPRR